MNASEDAVRFELPAAPIGCSSAIPTTLPERQERLRGRLRGGRSIRGSAAAAAHGRSAKVDAPSEQRALSAAARRASIAPSTPESAEPGSSAPILHAPQRKLGIGDVTDWWRASRRGLTALASPCSSCFRSTPCRGSTPAPMQRYPPTPSTPSTFRSTIAKTSSPPAGKMHSAGGARRDRGARRFRAVRWPRTRRQAGSKYPCFRPILARRVAAAQPACPRARRAL